MIFELKYLFPNRVRKAGMALLDKLSIAMFAGGVLPQLSSEQLDGAKTVLSLILTGAFTVATLLMSYSIEEEGMK